jgi:hypothetical protein
MEESGRVGESGQRYAGDPPAIAERLCSTSVATCLKAAHEQVHRLLNNGPETGVTNGNKFVTIIVGDRAPRLH